MGEFDYFTKYPDRFADEILSLDLMIDMSETHSFSGFMPFQIDFMHDFLDENVPNIFLRCNRGGSKSFLVCYCAILDQYRHDAIGVRWDIPILAGSERQAGEAYRKYARKMVQKSPVLSNFVKVQKRNAIWSKTESRLMIMSASSIDVKGPRAKVQIIDEICSTPEDIIEDYWGEMITAPAWKCVIAGTPDDPGHISYEWEHDPKYQFKTHHWSAYDCTTDKGGWLTLKTIEQMKLKFRSIYAQRRNILGEWSSFGGSVIGQEYIDAATNDFHIDDLPDPTEVETWIIAGDPARSNHYATIITMGVVKSMVYIYHCEGYQNITEQSLRKKYLKEALRRSEFLDEKDVVGRVHLVVEDAPISKALNDNLEVECAKINIMFKKSRFGSDSEKFSAQGGGSGPGAGSQRKKMMKNRFVENMCYYFEEYLIKVPQEFSLLIGQMIAYRWMKRPGKTEDQTTGKVQKGNDDFIDALMHGLMRITQTRHLVGRKVHIAMNDTRPLQMPERHLPESVNKKKKAEKEELGTYIFISRTAASDPRRD